MKHNETHVFFSGGHNINTNHSKLRNRPQENPEFFRPLGSWQFFLAQLHDRGRFAGSALCRCSQNCSPQTVNGAAMAFKKMCRCVQKQDQRIGRCSSAPAVLISFCCSFGHTHMLTRTLSSWTKCWSLDKKVCPMLKRNDQTCTGCIQWNLCL